MGKHVFKKTEPTDIRGLCVVCRKRPQKHKGGGRYGPLCGACRKAQDPERSREARRRYDKALLKRQGGWNKWSVYKKDRCVQCGFKPQHAFQLDIDHIDGDRGNNDPANYQTLCANCHRLKTHICGDWKKGRRSRADPSAA